MESDLNSSQPESKTIFSQVCSLWGRRVGLKWNVGWADVHRWALWDWFKEKPRAWVAEESQKSVIRLRVKVIKSRSEYYGKFKEDLILETITCMPWLMAPSSSFKAEHLQLPLSLQSSCLCCALIKMLLLARAHFVNSVITTLSQAPKNKQRSSFGHVRIRT